ncbi:MAG: tetratricopeptide repeat-containing sensor histidine kinase [Bacteroidetes bacterium]|nr:tetratricopeptide repeat-containing sensor histidine kinase [Bacteroidota bacterium]
MNQSFYNIVKELNQGVDEKKKLEELKEALKNTIHNDVNSALSICSDGIDLASYLQSKTDIAYFKLIKGVCSSLLSQNDTAEELILEAIQNYEEIRDVRGLASSWLNLSMVYINCKDFKKALNCCMKSSKYNSIAGNLSIKGTLLNNFGAIYFSIEDYKKALKYFLESVKVSKELNDTGNLERCFANIGLIYKNLKDYKNALKYYDLALEIAEELNDGLKKANIYQNLSDLYYSTNELVRSLEFCDKSIALYENLGNKARLASNYLFKGKIYNRTGNTYEALTQCNLSLLIWDKLKDENGISETKCLLAELYFKSGNIDKAVNLAYDSILLAQRNNLKNILFTNFEFLSNVFSQKKDFEIAFSYKQKQFEMYKEIHDKEVDKITNNLIIQFEVEKFDYETKKLKEEKNNLTLLNEKLEKLNSEKNEFIGILAHDLRNPLGAIFSLSELYLDGSENLNEEQTEIMQEIKISSEKMLALISNLLNLNAIESGQLEGKPAVVNLTELTSRLIKENINSASQKGISISISKPDYDIKFTSYKIAVEQIITNVLTNAIKYTFPNKNIFVGIYLSKEDEPVCEIMDEGPGFTEKDKEMMFQKFAKLSARPTAGENSVGLGLSIVKKLADVTGAKIHIESSEGKGAKFIIIFKDFKQMEAQENS